MNKEPGIPIFPESTILILDDDEALRTRLKLLFERVGLDNVMTTGDRGLASSLVAHKAVGLVLLDLNLPEPNGESFLAEISSSAPEIPVIVMTGVSEPETIVRCLKAGAVDYIVKPVDDVRLMISIWNALATFEYRREAEGFRERIFQRKLEHPEAFAGIITRDMRMMAAFTYAESVARSRQPVLITGETGTGKELFARAIHQASGRKGPFVAVNVGGLDDAMFSDCLFGHRKGAYTGADTVRPGMLKEAEGGTILLDEIGDLEIHSQVKLLRLLQENEYYPLGADTPSTSDARVLAATTRDLRSDVASGKFRSDLFYRLQTHPLNIPPLRDRHGDLKPLIRAFLEKSSRELGQTFPGNEATNACADKLVRILADYPFPGNVRELESLIHDAVTGARGGKLDLEALKQRIGFLSFDDSEPSAEPLTDLPPFLRDLLDGKIPTMEEVERELSQLAVDRAEGNLSQAAQALGISRQTLYNKLKKTTHA